MTRYLTTLLAVTAFLLGMTVEESYGQYSYTPQDIVGYFQYFDVSSGYNLPNGWTYKTHSSGYRTINSNPGTVDNYTVYNRIDSYNQNDPGWTMGNNELSFYCKNTTQSSDWALVFQRRPQAYTINLIVALRNNIPGGVPLTSLDLSYDIVKYGYGTNGDGSYVELFYTTNATAAEVQSDGMTNTNPATGWVRASSTLLTYSSDATNTNPGLSNPPYQYPLAAPSGVTKNLTFSPGIPANGVLYLNWMFSFNVPVHQQGNNAQNGQEFGIDNFQIVTATPVELISFSALYRNKSIELKWKTATEVDNYGFEIERSYNQKDWSKIDFVAGQGTVNTPTDYTYTDKSFDLSAPVVSYRLRQLDRDGSYDYSEVVTVAIEASPTISLRNFPNPFNPSTTISFNLKTSDVVTLTVYNELGQAVQRVLNNEALNAGSHAISFNGDNLPSGTYMYELRTSSGTTINKMILSK